MAVKRVALLMGHISIMPLLGGRNNTGIYVDLKRMRDLCRDYAVSAVSFGLV